jgi:hypothetical protein
LGLITAIGGSRANSLRAESTSFHGIKRKKDQQLMKSEDNKAKCRFPTATQYSRSLHEQQQQLLHLTLHRPHPLPQKATPSSSKSDE